MVRRLFIVWILAAAAFAQEKTPAGNAYFFTTDGWKQMGHVICDGAKIADLQNKRYIALTIPPGKHVLEYDSRFPSKPVAVEIAAGKVHYFRLEQFSRGFMKINGINLVEVSAEQAALDMKPLKEQGAK